MAVRQVTARARQSGRGGRTHSLEIPGVKAAFAAHRLGAGDARVGRAVDLGARAAALVAALVRALLHRAARLGRIADGAVASDARGRQALVLAHLQVRVHVRLALAKRVCGGRLEVVVRARGRRVAGVVVGAGASVVGLAGGSAKVGR